MSNYLPSDAHVKSVRHISEVLVRFLMKKYNAGTSPCAILDTSLSSLLGLVTIFEREQVTIDALPGIRVVLEERKLLREAVQDEGALH